MLLGVIQAAILSVLFIFIVHNLIHFLKSNLTVPKIKDLVNTTSQKYDNMYSVIQREAVVSRPEYVIDDLLPSEEKAAMKNELKNFLKTQLQSGNGGQSDNGEQRGHNTRLTNELTSLESLSSNSISYSNY